MYKISGYVDNKAWMAIWVIYKLYIMLITLNVIVDTLN